MVLWIESLVHKSYKYIIYNFIGQRPHTVNIQRHSHETEDISPLK